MAGQTLVSGRGESLFPGSRFPGLLVSVYAAVSLSGGEGVRPACRAPQRPRDAPTGTKVRGRLWFPG